jgi:hypothetical protein
MVSDHVSLNDAPVIWYCAEAIRRHGGDLRRYDGIQTLARVLDAWAYAMSMQLERPYPERRDVIKLARLVDPEQNREGLRRTTSVTGRVVPPHQEVCGALEDLLRNWQAREPLDWYREFERIHPLRHGNDFVGKILLNWIANTLQTPFFPERNFWGAWSKNP